MSDEEQLKYAFLNEFTTNQKFGVSSKCYAVNSDFQDDDIDYDKTTDSIDQESNTEIKEEPKTPVVKSSSKRFFK